MALASGCEQGWRLVADNGRAAGLLVRLRQRSYVLPWSLFLFAEGTDAQVRAIFHTHVVTLEGAGLSSLLSDLAGQRVTELLEPDRAAKFSRATGPCLTSLSIAENK
jgi:hypothetical protein